jgi:hypothetical protein
MVSKELDKFEDEVSVNSECETETVHQHLQDVLLLRGAIIENCIDCIRDCGTDCLDSNARPVIKIKCPLQRVRMELDMVIPPKDFDNEI